MLAFFLLASTGLSKAYGVTIGSKNFTESYILAELLVDTLQKEGIPVSAKFGMGGTGFVLESLKNGAIDVYPEYTGTIIQAILHRKEKSLSLEKINELLKPQDLMIGRSLGFNNTYALIVRKETAEKYGLKNISDLRKVASQLRGGFTHEFLERGDGFYALRDFYRIPRLQDLKAMDHSLLYEALAGRSVDVTDAYTTDGKLRKFGFVILKDDRSFFPRYDAVWMSRASFVKEHPQVWSLLSAWEGKIDNELMIRLNADVEEKRATWRDVLVKNGVVEKGEASPMTGLAYRIRTYALEHFYLVFVSVFLSILIGFPLGYGATENAVLKQVVMFMSSAFQTIPSLALLCFMIPFFGVGFVPAVVALVLYALLPIVVNTFTGLSLVDKTLLDMSRQLGMNRRQMLWHVQIPISLPYILAGVKTSSITAIGTATLAALIGAGGFGTPILAGLALNDYTTIMEGAIPVCVMAFVVQILFQYLEKKLVSPGLY
jgi:osmoprotectant transport system permease protein